MGIVCSPVSGIFKKFLPEVTSIGGKKGGKEEGERERERDGCERETSIGCLLYAL